jgi:hypothetical protein
MELLRVRVPVVTGISLAPPLWSAASDGGQFQDRIRFTETDIVVTPSASGELEGEDAVRQVAELLQVDPASGWLQLRPAMIGPLLKKKERAAFDERQLLAVTPVAPDRHQYLLLDRQSGQGRVLADRPDSSNPSAQRLWDALQRNFSGELKPPAVAIPEEPQRFVHETHRQPVPNEGAVR